MVNGNLLLLSAWLFISSHCVAESLVLGGPPWPPFLLEGENSGFAEEVVIAAFAEQGVTVKVAIKPWARVLAEAEAEAGPIGGLVGLWFSQEREKHFVYSSPYYINEIVVVSHARRTFRFRGLDDLEGHKVGVRNRGFYGHAFAKADNFEKISVSLDLSILRMVQYERIDAGVGDRLIFSSLIDNEPELQGKLTMHSEPIAMLPLHVGISRKLSRHRQLVEKFNQGLQRIRDNGELQRIYGKWTISQLPEQIFTHSIEPSK